MSNEKLKKRSRKSGLPPGSLIYIGKQIAQKVKVSIIDYDENSFEEKTIADTKECFSFKDKPTVTWVNIDGVHDPAVMEDIAVCFGLHPLVQEDILNTDQRPKIEDYIDYQYIVLKMLSYDVKEKRIKSEQVSFILGQNYLISFQEAEKEGDVFGAVRERLRVGKTKVRKEGPDYLVYSLIDAIVDNYFVIIEKMGEEIDLIEESLVANPQEKVLSAIHKLKKEVMSLRRSVWPLREVISTMTRAETKIIKDATRIYLRDVYDHTVQVIDTIETYRDMISSMVDIYLSSMSNRLNEVMKVLTIIATIFMPLTFITGFYGMNFRYFPEIAWRYGYLFVWTVILCVAGGMLTYFKRKKWF